MPAAARAAAEAELLGVRTSMDALFVGATSRSLLDVLRERLPSVSTLPPSPIWLEADHGGCDPHPPKRRRVKERYAEFQLRRPRRHGKASRV